MPAAIDMTGKEPAPDAPPREDSMSNQPVPFHAPWRDVDQAWIDVESTGVRCGIDRAVEVGIVRTTGGGEVIGSFCTRVDPGMPIPAEATAIHHITDADVAGKPTIGEVFEREEVRQLLHGAQPCAYNGSFDRHFVPASAFADWSWPWIDCYVLVKHVDKWVSGKGRHKLANACERHGVALELAHSAMADAVAASRLFHVLMSRHGHEMVPERQRSKISTIGQLLTWQQVRGGEQWGDLHGWLARQPARAEGAGA